MKRLFLSILLAASATLCQAEVIYNNGLGQDFANSGYLSTELYARRAYDDFTLTDTRTIESVFFQVGLTEEPFEGSFTFTVYDYDEIGVPGATLYTKTLNIGDYSAVANGIVSYPFGPFYDVNFNIAPLTLGAGDYLVSFYGLNLEFRTANTDDPNGYHLLQYEDVGEMYGIAGGLPFRLDGSTPSGAVPEPSTLLLAGIALAGLALSQRRRQRRS